MSDLVIAKAAGNGQRVSFSPKNQTNSNIKSTLYLLKHATDQAVHLFRIEAPYASDLTARSRSNGAYANESVITELEVKLIAGYQEVLIDSGQNKFASAANPVMAIVDLVDVAKC